MGCEPVIRLVVTGWLVALSVIDLRRRELPHWATTWPLVGVTWVTVALLATGECWWGEASGGSRSDGLAMGLAFLAVLLSDGWAAFHPAAAALGLAFGVGTEAMQVVALAWLISLALAKLSVMGEADAKVMMILIVLFPDPLLVACAVLAELVLGMALLVWQHGRAAPASLWLTLRGEGPGTEVPGMPLLAAGALAYVWGCNLL
jgi:hypothetical protein